MKRFTAILTCLLALASCAKDNCREFEGLTLDSALLGAQVRYSLVLPLDYSPRRAYPVLCLFHCIGGDHTTGIEYCDITHTLDSLVGAGAVEPMIVVMPDIGLSYCADAFDGSAPYESMLLEELLPEVESRYRTNGRRFTLGFSMGGFAAMAVALRNPDLFCGYAAMSPSVRTDAQYCAEMPQESWDWQWGNKFGGQGESGEGRLTDWYRSYCPLHLLEDLPLERLNAQRHFITVGNREGGSLAESNEMLHLALLRRGVPHRWKVSDGGHDFAFWRSELPDALRFADAALRGREFVEMPESSARIRPVKGRPVVVDGARLYMPELGFESTREFPCIYVFGASAKEERRIMGMYRAEFRKGAATPLAFCFMGSGFEEALGGFFASEEASSLRDSQRMRSAICIGTAAGELQRLMCKDNLFTNVVFVDPSQTIPAEEFARCIRAQRRYPKVMVVAAADSPDYGEAAALHIALKAEDATHYHYAYPSGDALAHFPEWLRAINYKFHD